MKSIYFDVSVPKILATKALAPILPYVYYTPISPVGFGDIPEQKLPGKNWVRVKSIMTGIFSVILKQACVMSGITLTGNSQLSGQTDWVIHLWVYPPIRR